MVLNWWRLNTHTGFLTINQWQEVESFKQEVDIYQSSIYLSNYLSSILCDPALLHFSCDLNKHDMCEVRMPPVCSWASS